jgi:hypothetical protein
MLTEEELRDVFSNERRKAGEGPYAREAAQALAAIEARQRVKLLALAARWGRLGQEQDELHRRAKAAKKTPKGRAAQTLSLALNRKIRAAWQRQLDREAAARRARWRAKAARHRLRMGDGQRERMAEYMRQYRKTRKGERHAV